MRTPCGYWLLELWNIEIMKRWRIYNNYTDHMSTPQIDLSYVEFGYNSFPMIDMCLLDPYLRKWLELVFPVNKLVYYCIYVHLCAMLLV